MKPPTFRLTVDNVESSPPVSYWYILDLPSVVMVETEGYESVASLVMGDVDDIFGAGSNPAEAIEDLRITLREARTQLSGMRDRLTPRLLRQLSALETMATFTGFYGPTSSAQDSRERAAAPITSNSADYIRRFKG